ncbi:YqaE/Pmp3 family membrane protein [Pontibacter sp. CAU 1760]
MKFRNLLHAVTVLIAGQLMFSCNSAEYYRFSAAKPEAYNTVKAKQAPATATTDDAVAPALASEDMVKLETKLAEVPVLEANVGAAVPAAIANKSSEVVKAPAARTETVAAKPALSAAEAEVLSMATERLERMTKAEKKAFKKEVKEAYRQSASTTSIVEIILAVLLPPLAVFLHDGIGTSFWISIILTLLFFIPGIIYALLVVTDSI